MPSILESKLLSENWLVHGFSTRLDPAKPKSRDFNLGFTEHADRSVVERNRATFARAIGAAAFPVAQMKQLHSDIIHVLRSAPDRLLNGDGLITNLPRLLLTVKTADCVPVLIADMHHKVVGAFHAGWRGTARRIVEKGVGLMRRDFASNPAHLRAAIGPCIRACCYQVGDDVQNEFHSQFSYAAELFTENFDVDPVKQKYPNLFLTARAPGHAEISRQIHLDLVAANRRQLLDAGVPEANIDTLGDCTACHTDRYFSHRAEFGKTGRLIAAIAVR